MNKMSGKSGLCQDVRCFFQIQRLDNRTLGQQVLDHLKSWCDSCLERQCLISAKSHKLPKTWKITGTKSKSNNHSRKIHEVSAPRSLNHPIIPQYPSNPCPPVTVTRCSTAMLYYALLLSWAAVCQTLSHMICHHRTIATCIFFQQKMCCNLWNTTLHAPGVSAKEALRKNRLHSSSLQMTMLLINLKLTKRYYRDLQSTFDPSKSCSIAI